MVDGQVRSRLAHGAIHFGAPNARLEDSSDRGGDPVLQLEDVGRDAVVPVSPHMGAGLGLDQFARYPELPEGRRTLPSRT